jgi:DNA-binding HxlR family transcriptional regulator
MRDSAFSAAGALRDPVERTIFTRVVRMVAGRWKLDILALLQARPHRFSELRRAIPGVTAQMLTVQLRELEADGLVQRRAFDDRSPRVEYLATRRAERLDPFVQAGVRWLRESAADDARLGGGQTDAERTASQA